MLTFLLENHCPKHFSPWSRLLGKWTRRDKWRFRIDADNMLREIEQKGLAYKFPRNVDYCDMLYRDLLAETIVGQFVGTLGLTIELRYIRVVPLFKILVLIFRRKLRSIVIVSSNVSNQSINVELFPQRKYKCISNLC